MERELPKIVQENLDYYEGIIIKLKKIILDSKFIKFENKIEEIEYIDLALKNNKIPIRIDKFLFDVNVLPISLIRNINNTYFYKSEDYSYNIFKDLVNRNKVEDSSILDKLTQNVDELIGLNTQIPYTIKRLKVFIDSFETSLVEAKRQVYKINSIVTPKIQFEKHSSLNKCIKYLGINNFQAIQNISEQMPIDAQFIAFTGENGDGKTSILQAIGLGLYNSDDLFDEDRGTENTHIIIQYQEEDKYYTNDVYNNPEYPTLYTLRHHMKELKSFAAYGTSRLRVSDKKEIQNPLLNLDPKRAKLTNIFDSWLRDVSVNDPTLFEKIKSIILDILPNVSEIKKKDETKIISDFLFIEKGIEVEFKHLSAGHKSIVLMIGDMIMRLSEAQPEIKNPSDFTGIVLIDEIEAHLHPKWQKEFPHILSTTFPKVQFIVTTHSAISLLGMPENTVFFRVQRSEEKGTYIERIDIDVKNLLPNAIYTSPLFDMESIRSTENKGIEELNVEDNFEEIIKKKENKKRLKELSEKFVFTPPKS